MFEAISVAKIISSQKEARGEIRTLRAIDKRARERLAPAPFPRPGVKGEPMIYDLKTRAKRQIKVSADYRENSNAWDIRMLGAITGLAGGILVALLGSTLTAVSWFTMADPIVKTLGTALLVITVPLLISGAHCLDLIENKRSA